MNERVYRLPSRLLDLRSHISVKLNKLVVRASSLTHYKCLFHSTEVSITHYGGAMIPQANGEETNYMELTSSMTVIESHTFHIFLLYGKGNFLNSKNPVFANLFSF